jgi:iron complex transport system substrate-binding protein
VEEHTCHEKQQFMELDTKAITYSDPITPEYLLDVLTKAFLEDMNG